jgi:hypothetical protein
MTESMHVLMAGRGEGKTTALMGWVEGGVQVSGYPGWSRVAIVANRQRHDWLKSKYWAVMEDFDHRVYTLDEIKDGHFTGRSTAYRLDDLNDFLGTLFHWLPIDGFTITASGWDDDPGDSLI